MTSPVKTPRSASDPSAPAPSAERAFKGNPARKHWHYLPSRGVNRRTAILAFAVVVLFAVYVLLGSYTVTIPDFFSIVTAHFTGGETIPGASFIVMGHKLPRAVVGLLAGLAFGLSGALFQSMLRNPLASPDVIGVSYGASAAAVIAIVVFGASGPAVSWAAIAGAAAIAALIYALSRGSAGSKGQAAGARLVLAGVGTAAALHAVVNFLLTRADIRTAADALVWLNGSLNPATWERAGLLLAALVVLIPAVAVLAAALRMMELGDDTAAALGVRVNLSRLAIVLAAVGLAATATAAAGPISFVAFLAGPIARRFVRSASLPAAGLTGAVIVLAADFFAANIAPVIFDGTVLPVGIVTGAFGAPFLLWLLVTSHRKDG